MNLHIFIKKPKQVISWWLRAIINQISDPDKQFNVALSSLISNETKMEQPISPIIFDIGAHHGESIARFKKLFPSISIHSFEPDKDNFKLLEKHWSGKKDVFLNNIGVSSAKGMLTFHRNLKSNTSSFHKINMNSEWAENRSARYGVSAKEYTEKSYDVPVTDLDSYIKDNNIQHVNLLKMDTQGHEDEVLKGCKNAIDNGIIDIIVTELIVGDPYMKSLQFYDLEKILIPAGYRLYGIDRHGDLLNTPSLYFNVIYVHEKYLKLIS